MTALGAKAKAFRENGASLMRCPHRPDLSISQRRRHLLLAGCFFVRLNKQTGGDSVELGTD